MPTLHVAATTQIERSIKDVTQAILDFNTWPAWSPWLLLEPEAEVSCYGKPATIGHGYRWDGKKVGSGNMAWTDIESAHLQATLNFLKPFKSNAQVGFKLSEDEGKTTVEWVMDSSLPFFLFFMQGTMKNMIALDYQRGLALLKDYLEIGSVPLEMKANGVVDTDLVRYLGVSQHTTIDAIAASMGPTFEEAFEKIRTLEVTSVGPALSVYHQMNMRTGRCHYTAAVPVSVEDTEPEKVSFDGLVSGILPACCAYKVVHRGPYRHLGNSWALAISNIRHLKMKPSKREKPYELYLSDPATTAENDLITEIYVPVR